MFVNWYISFSLLTV